MPNIRIPQSVAKKVVLKAYLASDHVSAATSKTIAVVISKNGGAFGNPAAGATNATEIANGWYYVDLGTGDTDTLGPLIVRGSVATVDDVETVFEVSNAYHGGFTGIPNAAAEAAGGLFTRGTGAGQINQDANGRIDANVKAVSGDATAADNAESFFDGTGYAGTNNVIPTVTTLTNAPANSAGVTTMVADYARRTGDYYAGTPPTAGAIADAVLDEAAATHTGLIAVALPNATPGANGGLPTTNGSKLNQTADLTAGQTIAANLTQILGTALTETSGLIAAAFKKFFNVATPTGTVNSLPDAVAGAASGLAIVGSVMGKSPATLAAGDVSGNLPADVKAYTVQPTPTIDDTAANHIADHVLDEAIADHAGVGTVGKTVGDNLNAPVGSIPTNPMLATAKPTVGGYDTGQDPATLLLVTPANKINTDAANAVKIQKMAVTLAAADVSNNLPVDVKAYTVQPTVTNATLADAAITAAKFAADAIDANALKADAATEIANALLDLANGIETGHTPRQALRTIYAASAGKVSGADGATVTIRDVTDNRDAIVATVDANGNRSAVTLDETP